MSFYYRFLFDCLKNAVLLLAKLGLFVFLCFHNSVQSGVLKAVIPICFQF